MPGKVNEVVFADSNGKAHICAVAAVIGCPNPASGSALFLHFHQEGIVEIAASKCALEDPTGSE